MITTEAATAVDFKQVVIASDFGDDANHALDYAKSIVRSSHGALLLVHVGTPVAYIAIPEGAWLDDPERPQRECEQTIALRQALCAEGLNVSSLCPFGDVEEEIADAAKNHKADLVVVGTHARHGLERLIFGSHAELLAKKLRIPLLIVGPHAPAAAAAEWKPQRLLCVTSTDAEGLELVTSASTLARAKHAHLQVAYRGRRRSEGDEEAGWLALMQQEMHPAAADRVETNRIVPLRNDEAESVIEMARQDRSDLVVIEGRHKLIDLPSWFGQGELPRLLAQAPCPVLVVPS